MASRKKSYQDDNSSPRSASLEPLSFPISSKFLWNEQAIGETLNIGARFYRPTSLVCLERCIRLAHKHAKQFQEKEKDKKSFEGFLIGNLVVDSDEMGMTLYLDRFDSGISNYTGERKTPSAPMPNDVIIPVCFEFERPDGPDVTSNFTVEHFRLAMELLHDNIRGQSAPEVSQSLQMRILCYSDQSNCRNREMDSTEANLEMRVVALSLATAINATPIKSIPVISTALAKNLSSTLSHFRDGYKTGFLTMDQTRKILLFLESDPKVRKMPIVGIWVSGVTMIHHPFVVQSALRFMYCSSLTKRKTTGDGEFLIMLHSLASSKPQFFQCKLENCQNLDFDILFTQSYIEQYNPQDSSSTIKTRLDNMPPPHGRDEQFFIEALNKCGKFPSQIATNKQQSSDADMTTSPRSDVDDVIASAPKHDDGGKAEEFLPEPNRMQPEAFLTRVHELEPSLINTESSAPLPTMTSSTLRKPATSSRHKPVTSSSSQPTMTTTTTARRRQLVGILKRPQQQQQLDKKMTSSSYFPPARDHGDGVGKEVGGGGDWLNHLPPQAYKLLKYHDEQMKMLQQQIRTLLQSNQQQQQHEDDVIINRSTVTSPSPRMCDQSTQTWSAAVCDRGLQTDDVITTTVSCGSPAASPAVVCDVIIVSDENNLSVDVTEETVEAEPADDVTTDGKMSAEFDVTELVGNDDVTNNNTTDSLELGESACTRRNENQQQQPQKDEKEGEPNEFASLISVIQRALQETATTTTSAGDQSCNENPSRDQDTSENKNDDPEEKTLANSEEVETNCSLSSQSTNRNISALATGSLFLGNHNNTTTVSSCMTSDIFDDITQGINPTLVRKYLSKERCAEILSSSGLIMPLSGSYRSSQSHNKMDDCDVTQMSGMDLISPGDMSMATRKFFKNRRLLDDDDDDDVPTTSANASASTGDSDTTLGIVARGSLKTAADFTPVTMTSQGASPLLLQQRRQGWNQQQEDDDDEEVENCRPPWDYDVTKRVINTSHYLDADEGRFSHPFPLLTSSTTSQRRRKYDQRRYDDSMQEDDRADYILRHNNMGIVDVTSSSLPPSQYLHLSTNVKKPLKEHTPPNHYQHQSFSSLPSLLLPKSPDDVMIDRRRCRDDRQSPVFHRSRAHDDDEDDISRDNRVLDTKLRYFVDQRTKKFQRSKDLPPPPRSSSSSSSSQDRIFHRQRVSPTSRR